MSDSLRDQLLGLGFKTIAKPERKPAPRNDAAARPASAKAGHDKPAQGRPPQGRPANARPPKNKPAPRTREEIDLAKAFALRHDHEKRERIEAERIKQEQARLRREAKAKLTELLKDKALNDPNAEIVRHFEYGGKIKRIYVNAEQLKALNAGELGVVQDGGRYVLVLASLLPEVEAIFPDAISLRVDPDAPAADDPYSDPAYRVPDDLVW